MSEPWILAVLVGIGIVTALALLAFAARRPDRGPGSRTDGSQAALGMSIGMLLGALLGTIVWISTGQFVFWVIFMGGGMVAGLSIGQSWASRSH